MTNSPSFDEVINTLAPAIKQLEATRTDLLSQAKKQSALRGGMIIGASMLISFVATGMPGFGLLVGLALAIPSTSLIFGRNAQLLSPIYKRELIGKFIEALIEKGRYQPESGISESEFNRAELFGRPDRYHSEDLISGKIGKTSFRLAEVHAEEKRASTSSKGERETSWIDLFKGFMFVADFNKHFSGQTIVRRDSFFRFAMSNRVKLEDPVFEKHFDVSATDQVEARYILSPAMMERMVKLDNLFDKQVLFSFHRSQVVILIQNSRNHFESSLWKPVDERKTLEKEYNTLVSLLSIVELLDLNTRIWTKE